MPKFKVPFEITGAVEIVAENATHAQEIFESMRLSSIADHGDLESFDPEEIPRDVEGELADKHWDRMKEDTL